MLLTKPGGRGRQPKLMLENLDPGPATRVRRVRHLGHKLQGSAHWGFFTLVPSLSSRLLLGFVIQCIQMRYVVLKVTALESFTFKKCFSGSHFRNPFLRIIFRSPQCIFNYSTSLGMANLNLLKVNLIFRNRHKPFVVKSPD